MNKSKVFLFRCMLNLFSFHLKSFNILFLKVWNLDANDLRNNIKPVSFVLLTLYGSEINMICVYSIFKIPRYDF